MTTLIVMLCYIAILLSVTLFSTRLLKKTSGDYFLASRGIGPFMLLMSIFGTTMTAFALVGSTGKTFDHGIGVYGLMASWSGIIHSVCFFLLGAKIWAMGKKHGYVTQISFFRDRYRSDAVALLLFPVMTAFVMIYILMGVVGAGRFIQAVTPETFAESETTTEVTLAAMPEDVEIPAEWQDRLSYDAAAQTLSLSGSVHPKRIPEFASLSEDRQWKQAVVKLVRNAPRGAIPYAAGMGFISVVVLIYVFFGGMRATAWANTFQTIVFMIMGVVAFAVITAKLGGPVDASQKLLAFDEKMRSTDPDWHSRTVREGHISQLQFLTYCFIPLSVGMFPHLFQHWLTARRASTFKLSIVAHPLCIMVTWIPCVLLGMWASGNIPVDTNNNAVLGVMVAKYSNEILAGLIGAGVLAAIMSSMDSQFLCLGSIFTNDIVARYVAHDRIRDEQRVRLGRIFVFLVVLAAFLIGLFEPGTVFNMGVWCFTGFASLFPVAIAAVYWRRSNKEGVIAAIVTTAALWLYFLLFGDVLAEGEFLIFGMMPVTILIAASTLALVVVTLMTPPPDEEIVRKFFPSKARGST